MNKTSMKKGLSTTLAILFVLSVFLIGCSKGAPQTSEKPSATDSSKAQTDPKAKSVINEDKKFEINLMDWQEGKSKYGQAYNYGFDAYMKLHPNVKINHIYQPNSGGGYDKLLDTQFVAHKAPDAMQLYAGWITKYTEQEYLMLLDGYMHAPTPYSDGKNWVDTYVNGENALSKVKSLNKFGAISYVPVDSGPGGAAFLPFFFNKDLLDKAGVTKVPATWAEFIEACKKLKSAGITPVAADNGRFLNWINSFIGSQMGEGYLNTFFDGKYASKDLYQDKAIVALMTGKIGKTDPILNDIFDIVKDFSQYWEDGWAGTGEQPAQQLFLYKKAAFLLDGNWQYGFYEENIKDFKFGVMPFPMLTKETSKHAAEGFPVSGDQVTYGWGFNKDLEKDPDKLKVVLDIFQFITSKEINGKMAEIGLFTPVTAGVNVPDKLKLFMANEKATLQEPLNNAMYNLAKDGVPLSQEWLTGKTNKQQFLDKLQQDDINSVTQKVKDALDAKIGLPNQISTLEAKLAEQQGNKSPDVVVKATKGSLDLAKLKLEFYKQYAEPALKK